VNQQQSLQGPPHEVPRIRVALTRAPAATDTSYIAHLRRGLAPAALDALPPADRQRLLGDLAALGTTPDALLREEGGVLGPIITPVVELTWSDGAIIVLRTDLSPEVEATALLADRHAGDPARSYVAMNHILAHTFGAGPLPARLADLIGGSFAHDLVGVYARLLRGEELPTAYDPRIG
jgi:hypothetical protein